MKIRFGIALATVVAMGAVAPGAASAASATVTGDTGTPVPLGGAVTIRNLDADIDVNLAENEKRVIVDVTGPAGQRAIPGTPFCSGSDPSPSPLRYFGNGTYTVTIKTFASQDDFDCEGTATETKFTFNYNAFSGVAAPAAQFLRRAIGSVIADRVPFKIEVNPGAVTHEIRFAKDATLGPDGGITSPNIESAFLNSSTGTADISFQAPGTYTVVARPMGFNGSGSQPGPWSAPVTVKVFDPFDLVTGTTFTDAIGPSYKIAGTVRSAAANGGRITISIARGLKGGKFKRLTTAKINSKGRFTFKFKITRRGKYRLRYTFKGNSLVSGGFVQEGIQIRRVFR
jgi:hypothetical protein